MRPVRPALTVLAGIVVLAMVGCGGSEGAQQTPKAQPSPARPSSVRELDTIAPLKDAFEAAAGRPRLLLILSPT